MRLICLTTLFLCLSITAFAQSNLNWGLTLESGIGILTNTEETASSYYVSHPFGKGSRSVQTIDEIGVDFYFHKNFQFSVGFRQSTYRYYRDSILPTYDNSHTNWGDQKIWRSNIQPTISLTYSYPLAEKLEAKITGSFGFPSILNRSSHYTTALNPKLQENWNSANSSSPRYNYNFGLDYSIYDANLSLGLRYSMNNFSIQSSLSYYLFRTIRYGLIPFTMEFFEEQIVHHGLYMKLGVSYRFKGESN